MKEFESTQYAECIKCSTQYPSKHLTGGMCSSCLSDDHICEDCWFMQLPESGDINYADCLKAVNDEWEKMLFVARDKSKIKDKQYYYCSSERGLTQQCDNFKFHVGA